MHDLVIRGGNLVDGTGAPAVRADVAVEGDRIAAIGPGLSGEAARMASRLRPRVPGTASNFSARAMADSDTPQSWARSCTDQRRKARAARI